MIGIIKLPLKIKFVFLWDLLNAMTDQLNAIKLPRKPDGPSKKGIKMTKRYDVLLKKWLMGYWVGRSFKVLAVLD